MCLILVLHLCCCFFYIRAMLLLFCLFIKLPFLVMLLLVFFRSIRATVLDNTRITFGFFSSLYRDKRAFLLMLLFGVFFLFESFLYFSFILFEGGVFVLGVGGVVSFFVFVCVFLFLLLVLLFRFNNREIFL